MTQTLLGDSNTSRKIFELSLVAAMLACPEYKENYSRFLMEESASIYARLKKDVTFAELRSSLPEIPNSVWDMILKRAGEYHTLSTKSESAIAMEVSNLISKLSKMDLKEETIKLLRQAILETQHEDFEAVELTMAKVRTGGNVDILTTKELMKESMEEGESFLTGIKQFDDVGGFYMRNLMTIGGDSGTMKTMVALWICLKILKENPTFTAFFFEKEMPEHDIARRLVSFLLRITATDIKTAMRRHKEGDLFAIKQLQDMIEEKVEADTAEIFSRLTIVPTTKFNTATDIANIINQYKPNLWVLDFVTSLGEESGESDMNMFMHNQMTILKRISHQHRNFGILLAQMKQNALDQKAVKVPDLQDLEWSSKIKQFSAYLYMTFFPSNYYTPNYTNGKSNYFYMVKRKGREAMPPVVPLLAKPEYADFNNPPPDAEAEMLTWMTKYMGNKLNANK